MSKRRLALLIVLLLAIAAGGYAWLQHKPSAANGMLTLYGNVDIREVQPAFNDTGHVTTILVQEGAVVKRGQLLATLDDTRYAAALAQAKAQMQNQKQVLDKLLAGSRPEEIAQAKATMDALKATYLNDEANYRRYAMLATTNAASIQQRDNAKAAFDTSRQQYEAAKQAHILAVKGPRAEDIAAARAAYEASVAAVALAQREFDDTRLYAAADGIVEDRILEPGDMASPNTPVFTIALTSPLWVRAYVPETKLGHIRLGMAATISTDSYPGRVYHGWVGYLAPTSEFTPKTVETPELRVALVYQLRVYVCDGRNELRLGMPATVHIDLNQPASTAAPGCGSADATRQ
jgi:HlyD family secretion protein